MAHNQEGFRLPMRAASAIAQYVPVRFVGDAQTGAGSAVDETVVRTGSFNEDVLGMTLATVASPGGEVAVQVEGVIKGIAGASLGAGARVGVGSTNGILIPLTPSNIASSANGSGLRFAVGKALVNAAAGDNFAVLIQPEQIL
jgi:hypothetical protein